MSTCARMTLGLLMLGGCYTHEEYLVDEASATCSWYERCDNLGTLGYASWQECFDEVSAWDELAPRACEAYDPGMARDCVAGIEALPCTYEPADYPAACASVCAPQ